MRHPKRVYFRLDRPFKLKEFRGYQKGHTLPERDDAHGRRYLGWIAQEDLKLEMDSTFNRLREHFGFKRKQMESSISPEGEAVIHTPAFDYSVAVKLDREDLSRATVRRELTPDDLDSPRHPGFAAVFPLGYDTLRAEWDEDIDILDLFDELEEDPIPKTRLRIGSDNSFFELAFEGFAGVLRLEPRLLSVGGAGAGAPVLMNQFLQFQKRFAEGATA